MPLKFCAHAWGLAFRLDAKAGARATTLRTLIGSLWALRGFGPASALINNVCWLSECGDVLTSILVRFSSPSIPQEATDQLPGPDGNRDNSDVRQELEDDLKSVVGYTRSRLLRRRSGYDDQYHQRCHRGGSYYALTADYGLRTMDYGPT